MLLTDEQVQEYEERGFLFFPGLFSANEMESLRKALPGVYNAKRPEVDRENTTGDLRCVFACHTYDDTFARLSRHPKIVEPIRQLLDGDIYMHQFSIQPKVAFNGQAWGWHQDYTSWSKIDGMPDTRAVNTGLFIEEVSQFNGPLIFIPGSHRHGILKHTKSPTNRFPTSCVNDDVVADLVSEGGLFSPQGPAGSFWIFHANLVHASSGNMSPYNRTIVTQCYAHVENGIRTPTRPEWVAHTDFSPVVPMENDCLVSP
ncbi:MAG: ectoine hydroxylase [Saprospiraceae bacterium]|jgi:ectoine hydroxylase